MSCICCNGIFTAIDATCISCLYPQYLLCRHWSRSWQVVAPLIVHRFMSAQVQHSQLQSKHYSQHCCVGCTIIYAMESNVYLSFLYYVMFCVVLFCCKCLLLIFCFSWPDVLHFSTCNGPKHDGSKP